MAALFLIFGLSHSARAAHLIGGELSYEQVGDSTYVLTLRIYRDCFGGGASFDNPAYIFLYDGSGTYLNFLQLPSPAITLLPVTSDNPCLSIPPGICVEEGIYQDTVTLPPRPGGYSVVYQRCCRNSTIANLVDPGGTGSTYLETIPGPEVVAVNSGPVYTNFPPIVLCANDPVIFDHSATDADGDSLVYSLCAPFSGATPTCPRPAGPATGPGCPDQPAPPPYADVIYTGGFTAANPVPASPALAIDPVTGLLTGTPTVPGQYVVGVCVEEYRDGVLLGTHVRDFQFNIAECSPVVSASVPSVILECDDKTVVFSNLSTGASTYYWDFGVPGVSSDTSTLMIPDPYTYPDTGVYFLTLIANPGFICADTAYATVRVFPGLIGGWSVEAGCSGTPVVFTDTSFSSEAGVIDSWNWSLGDGTVLTDQNPVYQYADGGMYTVQLIVGTDRGCADTITRIVDVLPGPDAMFTVADVCQDIRPNFINTTDIVTGTITGWLWDFGNGELSTEEDPDYLYPDPGLFTVVLSVASANGCTDTMSQTLLIGEVPVVDAGPGATIEYLELYTLLGSGNGSYQWVPGGDLDDPTAVNPVFTGIETTLFTLTVTSADNCSESDTVTVFVLPEEVLDLPNAFSPNGDGANDLLEILDNDIERLDYFRVYNRWGELVYETTNLDGGWDGTWRGKDQEAGTYVYAISAIGELGTPFIQHGTVLLVR